MSTSSDFWTRLRTYRERIWLSCQLFLGVCFLSLFLVIVPIFSYIILYPALNLHEIGLTSLCIYGADVALVFLILALNKIVQDNRNPVKYSTFGSLALFVLGGICFLPAIIDLLLHKQSITQPADELGIIFGIVVLVLSGLVTSVAQQKDFALHVTEDLTKKLDAVNGFERFFRSYREDWSKKLLHNLIHLFEHKDYENIHIRKALRTKVEEAMHGWLREVHGGWDVPFKKSEERKRADTLKKVVRDAESYVRAVTYDHGTYLKDFWDTHRADEYLEVNKNQRDKVDRIFVLEDAVANITKIDANDQAKAENYNKWMIMCRIVRNHQRSGISFCIVGKGSVPQDLRDATDIHRLRSFLVCDDRVASESYIEDVEGYIAFNKKDIAEQLFSRFNTLLGCDKIDPGKFPEPT